MTSRDEQGDALGRTANPARTQALSACSLSFRKRPQSCLFAQLLLLPPTSLFFLFVCLLALPPVAAKMAEGEVQAGSQGQSGPKVLNFPASCIVSESKDHVTAVHTVMPVHLYKQDNMSSCSGLRKCMLESATPSLKFLILGFLGPQTLALLFNI